MILDFLAVKAVVHVNAVLVVERCARGNGKRDSLVSRTEKGLRLQTVLHNALSVELAELCELRTGLVVAGVDEVGGKSAALKGELAEFQHAAVYHELDKALFICHLFFLQCPRA